MAEFWEATHIRGQQTIGVWTTFAPAFTFGAVTLASHTADVALLLTHVNERDVQQDVVDAAQAAAEANFNFIHDVNVRAPQLISANLEDDDALQDELDDVFAVDPDTEEGNTERARVLISLWTGVNAKRAAAVPPLPPLLLAATTVAIFQTALTNQPGLLQIVANQKSELSKKKSQLRTTDRRNDRHNKRWYAAWAVNFPVGSPERDALSLVDTEEGTTAPTALEIATLTQAVLSVNVAYVAGGGRRAASLQLLYQVVGVDPVFAHPTTVVLAGQTIGPFVAGQTVNMKTKASNSAGATESAVKTIVIT